MNEDNEQTRVLSLDEEKLYLLAASQPLRDVATIMLEIGMRPPLMAMLTNVIIGMACSGQPLKMLENESRCAV